MKFDHVFNVTVDTTKNYLKSQLILITVTMIILAVGFKILDVPFWLLWAVLLALLDVLPIIGTGMFMIPWAIIAFLMDNPTLSGGLVLLYCVLVIVRQILEPIVVGKNIGLGPLWTIAAMVLGGMMFGPFGFILGPLVAAIITVVWRDKNKQDPPNYIDI